MGIGGSRWYGKLSAEFLPSKSAIFFIVIKYTFVLGGTRKSELTGHSIIRSNSVNDALGSPLIVGDIEHLSIWYLARPIVKIPCGANRTFN